MKRVLGYLTLVVFSLAFSMNVNAANCDYKVRAELNKMAYSVKAEYEFEKSADGIEHFNVYIYNITDDIYVNYKIDEEHAISNNTPHTQVDKGTFKFSIPVPSEPTKYVLSVRTTNIDCPNELRKFYLTIPIKNKFYDYDTCRRVGMEDYYYCKEWTTDKFTLSDSKIEEAIEKKYAQVREDATKCVGCEEKKRNDAKIKSYAELRNQIIKGLVIGITLDAIVMVIQIIYIRRTEI